MSRKESCDRTARSCRLFGRMTDRGTSRDTIMKLLVAGRGIYRGLEGPVVPISFVSRDGKPRQTVLPEFAGITRFAHDLAGSKRRTDGLLGSLLEQNAGSVPGEDRTPR